MMLEDIRFLISPTTLLYSGPEVLLAAPSLHVSLLGPAACSPLSSLSGTKQELGFLLADAQQLSSGGSIYEQQLVFWALSGLYLSA